MLLPVDLHPHAIGDLNEIRIKDINSWGELTSLLRELKQDYRLQERMLTHAEYEITKKGKVEFQKWHKKHQQAKELWRIKIYELDQDVQASPYRIIYAHHPWTQGEPKSYFQVLAVVHRSLLDYDTDNELSNRITTDYNELRQIF